jgi:hypothetical protein
VFIIHRIHLCWDSGSSKTIRQYQVTTASLTNVQYIPPSAFFEPSESGNIPPADRIRQHFSSHQNQNQTKPLEPSESFNEVQPHFRCCYRLLLYFPFSVGLTKSDMGPHAPRGLSRTDGVVTAPVNGIQENRSLFLHQFFKF